MTFLPSYIKYFMYENLTGVLSLWEISKFLSHNIHICVHIYSPHDFASLDQIYTH